MAEVTAGVVVVGRLLQPDDAAAVRRSPVMEHGNWARGAHRRPVAWFHL